MKKPALLEAVWTWLKMLRLPEKVWEARFRSATFEDRAASAIPEAGRDREPVTVREPRLATADERLVREAIEAKKEVEVALVDELNTVVRFVMVEEPVLAMRPPEERMVNTVEVAP